ncbi:MAG: hypothetical protein HRU23_17530 [Gammaproteobacteria bacterium]|nr:hypothetical protein [Gammaproteobacteria bacterium]
MLSNISMYNSLLGNQSANINASEQLTKIEEAKVVANSELQEQGNLSLSTRAQKLSAITSEFFSGTSFASVDTAGLIDRVYEYGLMSNKEYATLTDNNYGIADTTEDEQTSTQSLSQYLTDLDQRLSNIDDYEDSDNSSVVALKQALEHASTIFDDIEQAKKEPNFKSNLATTKQTLTELLNSTAFSEMELKDKVDMSNTIKTLDIIDKISINRLDNPMVNKYINIANY